MKKNILIIIIFLPSVLLAQLKVNTSFEGGNCDVISVDNEENEIYFRPDLKPKRNTSRVWFFFEVKNIDTSRVFTLYEINTDPVKRPVYPVYSYDKHSWHKLKAIQGDNFVYFGKKFSKSKVYFATGYPYLYTDLKKYLRIIKFKPSVEVTTLTTSEGGREVPLVIITDSTQNKENKKLVWIIARQHAFETPANYCLEGIINYLSSNQPSVQKFRKKAIVYIVPMMDVDNVAEGGTGRMQKPIDFNRDWRQDTSYWNAVQAAKELIDATSEIYDYKIFMDIHAAYPGAKEPLFAFINIYPINSPQSVDLKHFWDTYRKISGVMPNEVPDNNTNINFADVYNMKNYDQLDFSMTLECDWNSSVNKQQWTPSLWRKHGAYIGEAIVKYILNSPAK